MNHLQKGVLAFFVLMSLLIGLFPPWRYDIHELHVSAGFHFLFNHMHFANLPGDEDVYDYVPHIETTKLAVEWITLILVCAGSFALAKSVSLETFRRLRIPKISSPKRIKPETTDLKAEETPVKKPRSGIPSWLVSAGIKGSQFHRFGGTQGSSDLASAQTMA